MPIILYVGICLAGLMTGLMVGLSSSPVVGAALPALMAALAGGVAVFFRNPLDAQIAEVLKAWNEEEQAEESASANQAIKGAEDHKDTKQVAILKELSALDKRRKALPSRLGWALTLFLVVYFGGLLLGSEWRTYATEVPKSSTPAGLATALDKAHSIKEAWMQIYYYRNFANQGLKDETISKILTLPEEQIPSPSIVAAGPQQPLAGPVNATNKGQNIVPSATPVQNATPVTVQAKETQLPALPTPSPKLPTVVDIPPLIDPTIPGNLSEGPRKNT